MADTKRDILDVAGNVPKPALVLAPKRHLCKSVRKRTARLFRLIFLAISLSIFSPAYGALLFTFSTTDGSVQLNGGGAVTTAFTVEALVTNTQTAPGVAGSDRFSVDSAWFTMPSASLNRVLINTILFIDVGLPGAGLPTAVMLANPSVQLSGVLGGPEVTAWDRLSPLGPLTGLPGVATGDFTFTLANTNSITINTFDTATNNANDASLDVQAVPEPSSVGLVTIAGLALLAGRVRRRRSVA